MIQTVFPSVISSSKLHIQRQVFVRPILLLLLAWPGEKRRVLLVVLYELLWYQVQPPVQLLLETRRAEVVVTEMRPCCIGIKMYTGLSVLLQYTITALWLHIGKILIVYPFNFTYYIIRSAGSGMWEYGVDRAGSG